MGGEHAREGQQIYLHLACCILLILSIPACSRLPVKWIGQLELDNARRSMERGYFERSLIRNNRILQNYPESLGDQALYLTALIYAHPDNPESDFARSLETLKQLTNEYPESKLTAEAHILIELLGHRIETEKRLAQLGKRVHELEAFLKEEENKGEGLKSEVLQKEEEIKGLKSLVVSLQDQLREFMVRMEGLKEVDKEIEEKRRDVLSR